MPIANMPHDTMQALVAQLDQALYNHDQWCESIYGTLICRLAPDERDVASDAHRNCRFGQWLYSTGKNGLQRHPGIAAVVTEHERLHGAAATMLIAAQNHTPITIADFDRFGSAVKRMRLEMLTLKQELEQALYNLDPLTGAANRIGMLTRLREQQEMVRRKVHPCSIAMLDLDLFKAVNDTYGHQVGDHVLATVVRYVAAHMRPYDRVFRYGGEEFLISMPDADAPAAMQIVERIRTELATILHEAPGHPPFHVTVSFGLALLDGEIPVEDAIDRADKALYAAKRAGRNRALLWDPSMSSLPRSGEPEATETPPG